MRFEYEPVPLSGGGVSYQPRQDRRNEFLITCAFLPGLQTDALLGQSGFFENYKVIFERYHNRFQVIPHRREQS